MRLSSWLLGGVLCAGIGCGCERPPCAGEDASFPELRGPYVGQQLPGATAQLFAPGIVTTGMFTRDVSMAPDGRELYFTVAHRGGSVIMVTKQIDGLWQEARGASFSGVYRDFEPFVTPDGSQLMFLSNRPPAGQEEKPGWGYQNIWVVDRVGEEWGEPHMLPPPVNSDGAEFYPSMTREGVLYFTRGGDGRKATVLRVRRTADGWSEVEELGPEVNSVESQYNAFIAPDERLLLFAAGGREDSFGGSDCYVSFRDPDDRWTGPFNLGPQVNDEGDCDAATLSPDGRVLFFMSTRMKPEYEGSLAGVTLSEILARQNVSGNGTADIYWVDASFIEELRPR